MKVILVMAMTLNGKIARTHNELVDWTSKEDKKLFIGETKKAGVVIMGKNTYDTIGKPLPKRLNIVLAQSPERMRNIPGILEFANKSLQEILSDLAKRGFTSVVLAGGATVNAQFLKENLIDEIIVTIEPKIFGKGLSLLAEVAEERDLKLLDIKRINEDTVMLHYKVLRQPLHK